MNKNFRTPDLDLVEKQRIAINCKNQLDKGEAFDTFSHAEYAIHDPYTSAPEGREVDPVLEYGHAYITWYLRGTKFLPKRGPFYVELDLACAMYSDGSFCIEKSPNSHETLAFLDYARFLNLGIELIQLEGPGGGNPLVNIHGDDFILKDLVDKWHEGEDPSWLAETYPIKVFTE